MLASKEFQMRVAATVAGLFTLVALVAVTSAQTARPPESDAVHALVTELRALRGDLADQAQRGLRFQMLLARLQLQEQRIGHLDRQRADVAKSLLEIGGIAAMFGSQYEQFERDCAAATDTERKACESQMAMMKATAGSHQAREQQLRTQEQELLQAIATEQGRWADFSARLDELERTLTRPR
jgi:hypothetical protein